MHSVEDLRHSLPGQEHVLTFWEELSPSERSSLEGQISTLDVERLNSAFRRTQEPVLPAAEEISAVEEDRYVVRTALPAEESLQCWERGLRAIADGEAAAIVLAGGQASRLGANSPKGTLPLGIGFSEHADSLLYIQAAQIKRLLQLAKERFPDSAPSFLWLVMSSESTYTETKTHLDVVLKELGLPTEMVLIFVQSQIPAFDHSGRFLLQAKDSIATAPNGNGGIYESIRPLLPEIERRGAKYFHVYCVDNILLKLADPHFIGCSILKGADSAAKVIEKVEPTEAVGHVCRVAGHICVLEYSEISKELAERRDSATGKLFLRAGSIANHFFTLDFLKMACANAEELPYHVARKKVTHVDVESGQLVKPTEPNGIKLEKFIFDAFTFSRNFLVWQVPAETEFSPLKNAESVGKDCMSTCRRDLSLNHRRWLVDAGLISAEEDGRQSFVFISPLVSYEGEGLTTESVPQLAQIKGKREEDKSAIVVLPPPLRGNK